MSENTHNQKLYYIFLSGSRKLSALVTVDYLKERGKRANKQDFIRILEQVSDEEPEAFNKL